MKTLKKSVTVVAALSLTAASMVPAQANDEIGVVRGKTIGEWSGKWWQWAFSFPEGFPNSEPFKSEEVDCSAGQRGLVWFLAGTGVASNEPPPGPGEPLKRKCKKPIPRGIYLFFPLLNGALYNPDAQFCGPDEICKVEEKRRILDELFSDITRGPLDDDGTPSIVEGSQACKLKATLDGKPVQFFDYPIVRTQSPVFPLATDQKAVSDGVRPTWA